MSDQSKPQWLLPAGIGIVVIVLAVIALVREPAKLDPSTPEGTVQEYLQAISDEDYERALQYLDPAEFEGCTSADVERFAPREPFTATLEDADAEMIGSSDEVVVSVTLRFGSDGPFDSSWDTKESFRLIPNDGFWWITGRPWPHIFSECTKSDG